MVFRYSELNCFILQINKCFNGKRRILLVWKSWTFRKLIYKYVDCINRNSKTVWQTVSLYSMNTFLATYNLSIRNYDLDTYDLWFEIIFSFFKSFHSLWIFRHFITNLIMGLFYHRSMRKMWSHWLDIFVLLAPTLRHAFFTFMIKS